MSLADRFCNCSGPSLRAPKPTCRGPKSTCLVWATGAVLTCCPDRSAQGLRAESGQRGLLYMALGNVYCPGPSLRGPPVYVAPSLRAPTATVLGMSPHAVSPRLPLR